MSSLKVRQEIEAAWGALLPTLPLVGTINENVVDEDEPIWATMVYDSTARPHMSMGSNPWIEEAGIASVVIMSESGIGDEAVTAVADSVVKAFEMWISADKTVWMDSVDAPRPPDTEALGDTYRLAVALNYRYQTRGGL